jgi:methyltransferase family protein
MAPSDGGGGVDISAPAIELARELARLERVPNVNSERSDANVYPFPLGQVDLVFSRRRIETGSSGEEAA